MAKSVSMKIRGKDKLFRKLKDRLPKAMQAELEKAAFEGAEEMVATAKRLVPRDEGKLAESIVATRAGETSPAYSQPGGAMVVPEGAAMVTAGNSEVRYPHLVEYGTASHAQGGTGKGTQHPGNPPQPYFWPAFRLMRKRFKGRMSRALRKAIDQVAKG